MAFSDYNGAAYAAHHCPHYLYLMVQDAATGVLYGLRFTAYFPCTAGQGRYEVLDATVLQPRPTHTAVFDPTELFSEPPNSTAGIGWGADVGVSGRLRLKGAYCSMDCLTVVQCMALRSSSPLLPQRLSSAVQLTLHAPHLCGPPTSLSTPATLPTSGKLDRRVHEALGEAPLMHFR